MLKTALHLDFKSFAIDLNFELSKGNTLGLYGKSGIGKSTILRTIAGLNIPREGSIYYGDDCWLNTASNLFVKAQQRPTDLVFQDFALFPNFTVIENLKFAQRVADDRLQEIISVLDIGSLLDKKTTEISGGQKQRTAIGRLLAYDPKVLLFDEPFSALDQEIKQTAMCYIKSWISEGDKMAILASHDQSDLSFFTKDILEVKVR